MNHELDLRQDSKSKSGMQKLLAGTMTEPFVDQAKTLWNHLYNDTRSLLRRREPSHAHPRIDVLENQNLYEIRVDLPGVDANTIDLQSEGKVLHLKAKRRCQETQELKMAHCEHRAEIYERDIKLSEDAVIEEKSATYSEGILAIRIPRKAA
ncbi:MAG: hypothetical protein RIR26_2495 [Pseudomonadota bacterium]|jgi:HSP20 family protein